MPKGEGRARLLAAVASTALSVLVVRGWLLEPFTVSSDSMAPCIGAGSVALVFKPAAAAGLIRNGAVVAFASPRDGRTVIKRVVAGEGQRVAIRDSRLFIDDVAVPEPAIDHSRIDATYFGPETVPAGSVFVLGDNRGVSVDSRDFGSVPITSIHGVLPFFQR